MATRSASRIRSKPVIVVTLAASDEARLPAELTTTLPRDTAGRLLVLIDGVHRLLGAFATKRAIVPAWLLDEHESRAIRGTTTKPPRTWQPAGATT